MPTLLESHYHAAFDHAVVGMAIVSLEGKWLRVNPALCALLGYSEPELLATDFQSITYPPDLNTDLANLKDLVAGRIDRYEMEKRYYHRNGAMIWALLRVATVRDTQGNPIYFISQVEDIAALNKLREAQAEANRTASLESMAGGVAHEINNLLQPILTYAQLALAQPAESMPAKLRYYIKLIESSTRKTVEFSKDILLFSRGASKELAPVDVVQQLPDLIQFAQHLLPATLEVTTQMDLIPPLTIMANITRLQQILFNLFRNALHATEGKGHIRVECFSDLEFFSMRVVDSGPGISDELRDKVFDPFFSTKPIGEGAGMGLAVIRGILRSWQGDIILERNNTGGASFLITIPLQGGQHAHSTYRG